MYRLLIVDDERDICENLKLLVDWKKFKISAVYTASSFEAAADIALDVKPHIALVDVNLGGHYGYELITRLQEQGLTTVFCMISGYDDFIHVQRSMKAGAKDYLLKPISVQDLETFLTKAIVKDLGGTLPKRQQAQELIDPVANRPYHDFSNITNKIILIIRSDCGVNLSLVTVAEMFNMNSKYIGRVFLKDTGLKFTEYLMVYRMQTAKHLIESTKEQISDIVEKVGYSQTNNFYVHFSKMFGVSPNALRANLTGEAEPEDRP